MMPISEIMLTAATITNVAAYCEIADTFRRS